MPMTCQKIFEMTPEIVNLAIGLSNKEFDLIVIILSLMSFC